MSIEIRCTPHSQSAEIQIQITGAMPENYEPFIIVQIGETGYDDDYTKQRLTYGGRIQRDGTSNVDIHFTFVCYPLHSQSPYEINVYYVTNYIIESTRSYFIYETGHLNFSTQPVETVGKQNDRDPELTLKEKQINAIYLHKQLVKKNKISLEAFSCVLGIMDCAGNLNPTANMCFGSFDGQNSDTDYYPDYIYNITNTYISFWTGNAPDDEIFRGANIVLGEKFSNTEFYIRQNGITRIYNSEYYSRIQNEYFPTPWYYNHYTHLYRNYNNDDPKYGTEYKVVKAFTCLPIYHRDYAHFLYHAKGNEDNEYLDLYRTKTWLNIESVGELIQYLIDTTKTATFSPWWITTRDEYFPTYVKYPTFGKFAKCRDKKISFIAGFLYYCFQGGTYGSLSYDTSALLPIRNIHGLYNLECVQKKAEYWYKFFKKRRHPWWIYIKWNI